MIVGNLADGAARGLKRVRFEKGTDDSYNERWLQKLVSRYSALALPASIAADSAIYVDPYLWARQAVLRVRRKLLGSEASTQQALDQSPEVRAGIVARDEPTNPCKSPYMPEVLVITL